MANKMHETITKVDERTPLHALNILKHLTAACVSCLQQRKTQKCIRGMAFQSSLSKFLVR